MWRIRDLQFDIRYFWNGYVFENKEDIIDALTDYHDIDYTGEKDNGKPYKNMFERISEIENLEEQLIFLLEYGEWELEEAHCLNCNSKNIKIDNTNIYNQKIICNNCGFIDEQNKF